ncbi:hypothetical protein PAXRUDRAFT_19617 [Paxillus rubicundulus Ve08.2h10]|uniref:Uncharacterized protein n=1 Tax=Paxillus rubicundulus Ve08.2h10 TaxID=930991 RepID=A0A0D0D3Z0_9AGAM|nr:hypothetical protein PAXRUDRAFT_19617 [Paxillus rubicundulus Ve08.2h10]
MEEHARLNIAAHGIGASQSHDKPPGFRTLPPVSDPADAFLAPRPHSPCPPFFEPTRAFLVYVFNPPASSALRSPARVFGAFIIPLPRIPRCLANARRAQATYSVAPQHRNGSPAPTHFSLTLTQAAPSPQKQQVRHFENNPTTTSSPQNPPFIPAPRLKMNLSPLSTLV